MNDKFIALITARGGSKGLPRKNILPINGKPLIAWTIESAQLCKYVTRVFVSTDDEEIAAISSSLGAEIILRPNELASDTASSIDVVLHAIEWFEHRNIFHDHLVLLQPTSPLRTATHLDESLSIYNTNKSNLVVSVFEPSYTPIKSYIEHEDGTISGLYNERAPYMRRQDLPRAYQPNGAIYAFSTKQFKLHKNFPQSKIYPYVMSQLDSSDIDTIEDLLLAEKIMQEKYI